ncbi:DUF3592 domain-containing protein [Kovacikia minuta CCNUW1]|uniref:DUF3592 domain-containing protein n=1 Tax=Kovacikia minuta TaxID=2931930 RepID=UPI001CCDA070|nr:DUF3592 domain-containing protein [Kovacikia minuta]UBF26210.1 DUF3592 domain-containing protein [Kovacikia minuta CCNUW1]
MTPTEWLERLQVQLTELLTPHGFRNFPDRPWYFQRGNIAYLASWDYREKLFWVSFYGDIQARQSVNLVSLDLSSLEAESEQEAERSMALVLEAVEASLRDLPPPSEEDLHAEARPAHATTSTSGFERPPASTEAIRFSQTRHPLFWVLVVISVVVGSAVAYFLANFLTLIVFVLIGRFIAKDSSSLPDSVGKNAAFNPSGFGFHVSSAGVLIIFIGLYYLANFIWHCRRAEASQRWLQTEGRIIFSSVIAAHLSDRPVSRPPEVRYEYRVSGQDYIGHRIGFFEGLSNLREVPGITQQLAQNSQVTVYYNPQKPELSVLNPSIPRWSSSIPTTGRNFIVFGALLFVIGVILHFVLAGLSS